MPDQQDDGWNGLSAGEWRRLRLLHEQFGRASRRWLQLAKESAPVFEERYREGQAHAWAEAERLVAERLWSTNDA